ncbi:MAG: 50S ribosomal protein L18 [Candidatus Omnitrophica bacterium]|nr:50S ribosomal protein L18 [Candidatus Omnitrophota bacterium]MBL7151069.1 50S ribosomal protein L18 [Candidatus Omnitrophota bacterium]MBL7210527.1 50S ribosomal protein L18 [Candidatus Omnitrophota bacterium]
MNKRKALRLKRHRRIRLRICGTTQRPRLVVQRSLKNLSAQVIDDTANKTLFSYSTTNKEVRQKIPAAVNTKAAEIFGQLFAQKAKEKGITKIIFDRAGYLYHGKVKIFAEALRKGGLEF